MFLAQGVGLRANCEMEREGGRCAGAPDSSLGVPSFARFLSHYCWASLVIKSFLTFSSSFPSPICE